MAYGTFMGQSNLTGVQALTPSTTQTQAGGTLVTAQFVNIAAGNANDALTLPPATPGQIVFLVNAANAKSLFPPVGGAINGGTVNAVLSLTASKAAIVFYTDTLNVSVNILA